MVPDIANFSAGHLISLGIALFAWAWFMFFAVARSRAAGIEFQEPPLWLYGGAFRGLRWGSLPVFAYLGLCAPFEISIDALLNQYLLPFGLAAVDAALVGGFFFLILMLYRRWKSQRDDVVLEALTKGQIFGRIGIVVLILALLVGVPLAATTLLEIEPAELGELFLGGGEGQTGADLGAAIALLGWTLAFVIYPIIKADRLEDQDHSAIWARSTGHELFRWWWLGLTLLIVTGALSGIPGLDAVFMHPTLIPVGAALAVLGPIIFAIFWGAPMRKIMMLAEEGDHVAQEFSAGVRFSGIVAYSAYKKRASARGGAGKGDGKHLCPTCLRSVGDITAYKNFRFDACPYCGSFIPPVFTVMDFIKNQSARILPIVEEKLEGQKQKRARGVDETQLVQDLLRAIVALATAERGTDLHFGTEGDKFVVRCRTDGHLYNMMEFHKVMGRPLINSLKVGANLDITERRKPQDGRFEYQFGDKHIDLRVNTSPVADGETATVRLLYKQESTASIDKLGMSPRDLRTMTRIINSRGGLILVTGPTGSGKTTTLYNALEVIATGERNLITLEDPVEYAIRNVTQMQVNNAKGFTFATGLRTILRQDPDVIMVGEIRDEETAKMAIDAAATGHLVFSTLHATDAVGTIGRLSDLNVDVGRYATVLQLALAQRLIRVICSQCGTDQVIMRDQFEREGLHGFPEERVVGRRGLGCPHCHETGFYGREGVYEFFSPNDELRAMVVAKTPEMQVRQRARALGMRTMLEDGLVKVILGRTTLEEALHAAR